MEPNWCKSIVMHTVDKGAMTVLGKKENINKTLDLQAQKESYRPLTADPTNKQEIKLINTIRTTKAEGGIEDNTHKRL